jgi:hypothetical protein
MFKEKLYLWKKQQDKDCYHYDYKSCNTHERMKYIKQFTWQLLHKLQLKDKPNSESILKKPRRSKDRKKSANKRKLEKDL